MKVVDLPKYVMQTLGGGSGKYKGVVEFFAALAAVDEVAQYLSSANPGDLALEYLPSLTINIFMIITLF